MPAELAPPKLAPIFLNALKFYESVKTQWRVLGTMSGGFLIGLDYNCVFKVAKMLNYPLDTLNFCILQQIESFYIEQSSQKA